MENLSGKFVLRIPQSLHKSAKERALRDGISLNEVCNKSIKGYLGRTFDISRQHGDEESEWIDKTKALFKNTLFGVVLFGSAARGEAGELSDIDLLIVLDKKVTLSRKLYTLWDRNTRYGLVSPHFTHIPATVQAAGSLWLEVAIDGILLYETDRRISKFLAQLRRAIADGKMKRRFAHGHAYWIKNA